MTSLRLLPSSMTFGPVPGCPLLFSALYAPGTTAAAEITTAPISTIVKIIAILVVIIYSLTEVEYV